MTSNTYRLRRAMSSDIGLLVEHRHRMFAAIGGRSEGEIAAHDRRYRYWLIARMRRREVVGWIAETPRGEAAASGCLWYRPDQPRPENARGDVAPYILSMFTAPEHRARGLAGRIVRAVIAEARRDGHWQVLLHASPQGRSVYAREGFERRWEMRYWLDKSARTASRGRHSIPQRKRSRGRSPHGPAR